LSSNTASSVADQFAVPASLRAFEYLVHQFPNFWTRIARLETSFLQDQLAAVTIDRPLYVTGLARSGTTALLEMLAASPATVTHRYKDFPPVLTPYMWNRFLELVPRVDAAPRERSHGDGILITPDSPEAMEEVVWMRFFPDAHNPLACNRLGRETDNAAFADFYRNHIRKLMLIRTGGRYLAKGNYNVARLAYLHELFPDARFIVPVRHPFTHISSLMRQHERFSIGERTHPAARDHLRRVGHFEFGLDRTPINMGDTAAITSILERWTMGDEVGGWALYWAHLYEALHIQLANDPQLREAVLLIRYEDICTDARNELARVLAHCGLEDERELLAEWAPKFQQRSYYKSSLDEEQKRRITDLAEPVMQTYGYTQHHQEVA
jgi:hypothetical protein